MSGTTSAELRMPAVDPGDPRARAFCSPDHSEVFHAVAYRNDIWKDDPFDVDSIHDEARATFRRLVDRAATTTPSAAGSGRILLLQGEAGSGKTHLMRAFRNGIHASGRGYCGYLQMTSSTDHYGRYVLNNLIDSLDQPYHGPSGEDSGLMRLSTAVADCADAGSRELLETIRSGELDLGPLSEAVDELTDRIILDDRLDPVDFELVRALLYLQSDDPRIRGRVLKYLRCEELSARDRRLLGGSGSRLYEDAPQWVIQGLGRIMAGIESAPLVLCVDQLEDIYALDNASARFRRAMATLCDLVSRVPTMVVVISCLEDFYEKLKGELTQSIRDRIEHDPGPLILKGAREGSEIIEIVARRLDYLYGVAEAPTRRDDPTFPFPKADLARLAGLRIRDVLGWCHRYREGCIARGGLAPLGDEPSGPIEPAEVNAAETTRLEQLWNDFLSAYQAEIPGQDLKQAALLAETIRSCSDELENGRWFEAEPDGRMVPVEVHALDNTVHRLLIGICNGTARGGHLGRKVDEVIERAGENTPVIVRSLKFPSNPNSAITEKLEKLLADGGRRAVVEDSDWRAMLAMREFRRDHQEDPAFAAWLKQARPLSSRKVLQTILGLDLAGRGRGHALSPGKRRGGEVCDRGPHPTHDR